MNRFIYFFVLAVVVASVSTSPLQSSRHNHQELVNKYEHHIEKFDGTDNRERLNQQSRFRRSPDGWELSPHIGSDSRSVKVGHTGDDHDFRASYSKGRNGEDWHVGGTFRFKRSPDGWVLTPNIGSDGGSVQVGHEGDNHDFRAIYSKGQQGEDWHVGGTFRFKRSPDGWVLKPDIGSDGGSVQVGHEGDNHDFRAIYSKGNGGEDWHVGGTFRW